MASRLLFVHGAGGYAEDRSIADDLGGALGVPVDYPEFSDEDMSFEAWAARVRQYFDRLTSDDVVVAHSFGASIVLRVLAENRTDSPAEAMLLAMPDWTSDGWGVEEYAFTGPEPQTILSLHHCRDDEVVPFDHLALHAARLPSARIVEYPTGGHQFAGRALT